MATKGRNKPRVRGTKDMVGKVKKVAKKAAKGALRTMAPSVLAGAALSAREKGTPKKVASVETSLRPKPRPKFTSLRPKIRPTKKAEGGSLKAVPEGNKGLKKLPTDVRNKMGYMKKGGSCRGMGKATRGGSYGRMG
jgi:hypothetical protein